MSAWTPCVRMKMQALRSRCPGAATVKTRIVKWTDTLVDRFVCCGGSDIVFKEDNEEVDNNLQEQVKEHGNATDRRLHEPEAEPEAGDASDDKEDDCVSKNQDDAVRIDTIGNDVIDYQPVAEPSSACLNCLDDVTLAAPTTLTMTKAITIDSARAVRVLQRFLQYCVMAHRQRFSLAIHINTPAQDKTTLAEDSDEERTNISRAHFPSRLRPPQVYPLSCSPSSTSSSQYARSSLSKLCTTPAANVDHVRSAHSPSSTVSISSTDSCCSSSASASSLNDTHSDVVAENAVLRKRLETTRSRVYDFETDPRYMNQQQMRRLVILRHRDAMRAKLLTKQQKQEPKR